MTDVFETVKHNLSNSNNFDCTSLYFTFIVSKNDNYLVIAKGILIITYSTIEGGKYCVMVLNGGGRRELGRGVYKYEMAISIFVGTKSKPSFFVSGRTNPKRQLSFHQFFSVSTGR